MEERAFAEWQRRRRFVFDAEQGEEEREVMSRYRDVAHRLRGFPGLPEAARLRVVQFLPLFGEEWFRDLSDMQALLRPGNGDVEYFDRHAGVLSRIDTIDRTLRREHNLRYGVFAVYAMALGLAADAEIAERRRAAAAIRAAHAAVAEQRGRWSFVADWAGYYERTVRTPCRDLRLALRPQLRRRAASIAQFRDRWDDATTAKLAAEQEFLSSKLNDIEALGDPRVTKRDIKNMFWQLDLPFPDGVSDDYASTITFHQAYTLGLFSTTHIQSYSWDDRCPAVMEDDVDREERRRKEEDARERREREEAALRAAAAARRREEADGVVRRAEETAQRRLGERLWVAHERARMPYHHRWAGCELCGVEHVHWVAVARKEGATEDIVLCDPCSKEYESSHTIRRQYFWLRLEGLIDRVYGDLQSVGAIAACVEKRWGPRSFNDDVPADEEAGAATGGG